MAGIGFRLREIVTRKTFTEWVQLYVYAAVVFAGPWLFSILCLAALSFFTLPDLQVEGVALFTVTVVYCYAFSLITTGLLQLPLTRYVADCLYVKDRISVLPSFVAVTILTVGVQTFTAALFVSFCEVSLPFKVWATSLYTVISVIWMAMIYLTAAKDYNALVSGFFVGYLVSFVLGKSLAGSFGVEGLLAGFLAGQVLLLFWLIWRIFEEFPNEAPFSFKFRHTLRLYPSLMWAGLAYSAAIWVDKLIFWYGPTGIRIHSLFYTHFPYDSAMFFAYLTIVPTLSLFLVRIETDFYTHYKAYFGGILNKSPLDVIESRREVLADLLRKNLGSVIVYQGVVTVGAIIILPFLLEALNVSPEFLPVFRTACLGAVFHALLLILVVVLLYFDFRGAVTAVSLTFLILNGVFTGITTQMPISSYGWGYLLAAAVSLVLAVILLWNRLRNLEYVTFVRQPINQQKIVMASKR